uniref:Uncharacterized protein n=1 Tax=viral metagenome TaxID=1070528 RepID=A0A6M3KZV4_9ZZZZ
MKIYCTYCNGQEEIFVESAGPHLKATCNNCKKYIKMLSKEEKKQLEEEEDKLNYNHPERYDSR